jgi:hypothetical protein
MKMKSDFWNDLIQLAATMAAYEQHLTQKEHLQAIITEFVSATAKGRREMRLALWAVITFLDEISTLVPRSN